MLPFLQRARIRAGDALRYSALAWNASGWAHAASATIARTEAARLERLCAALQRADTPALERFARNRLAAALDTPAGLASWRSTRAGWNRYREPVARDPALTRTVVVKAPGPNGEKGLIAMLFEYNWLRLFGGIPDFRELDHDYEFLLCTSWSPTNYAMLALALAQTTGPVFVQVCNFAEAGRIERFHPRLRVVPDLLGCDWIDPDAHAPRPFAERDIDFLMVANWAPFKRHWQFFEALAGMPRDLKITLVGQPEAGHTADDIRRLARLFGVRQELDLRERRPLAEVMELQARAKVALIFTRREGCCVAAVEALFAGAALGMLEGAHVGPTAYINAQTGRLLAPRDLGRQLLTLRDAAATMDPRGWAAANISCIRSHARLNACVRAAARADGRPWTVDLAMPCWRPYPRLRDPADHARLRPVYDNLHVRWPAVFPAGLVDTAAPEGAPPL
jgi:glycosyltransferase involved in cell wall biosynthesis